MQDDAVALESWQRHLLLSFSQRHGSKDAARLSHAGARIEATALWHVASLSSRVACLVASFTATQANIAALQRAIGCVQAEAREQHHHCDEVAIVVHCESEQVFVVNERLLAEALRSPWHRRYFCIDRKKQADEEAMPSYLTKMLDALSHCVGNQIRDTHNALHGDEAEPAIIALSTPRWPPSAGIALAGWLLEYEVVYYCDIGSSLSDKVIAQTVDVRENWLANSDVWLSQDGGNVAPRLNGLPLTIVTVHLKDTRKARDSILCQFSVPVEMDLNLDQIKASIVARLESRLDHTPQSTSLTIGVTFEQQIKDRVAI